MMFKESYFFDDFKIIMRVVFFTCHERKKERLLYIQEQALTIQRLILIL